MRVGILKYQLSQSFNAIRWCLTFAIFAFVAVVSVSKYISLSDAVAINFSAFEITYLILNDTVGITYIYLPTYLFLICGIMFDDNFGSLEVLRSGSRRNWFISKYITFIFYTLLFFLGLFWMNFLIAYQVFPYVNKWSSDFIKVRVMMGQQVRDFTSSPLQVIGTSLGATFLHYLCTGTVSLWVAMKTREEAYGLLFSLIAGLGMHYLLSAITWTAQMNRFGYLLRNSGYFVLTIFFLILCNQVLHKKDFSIERKI
ncbi:hypothetical protein CS063_08530 [Sporanaerobium hydrogeniformans]|uniref:Uncharacterized protein n=1 Tax=Sporanaerobium hydrogeniformans TaxID=3072179 RepID=A0AC61DBZ1_9FIRM|nr:hypothetical protein [Sporanaerobium hydrogeniformans]PHV70804.1 hypothetical protein CS063_08530 [Sporanaerobium hydrogeniformans]